MKLDQRKGEMMFFVKDRPLPERVLEEGDEVELYHKGNSVKAKIKTIRDNRIWGSIISSSYDPALHPDLTTGKEVCFSEDNIFVVSKKKL